MTETVELRSGSGSHLDPSQSRQPSGFIPGFGTFCRLINAQCDAPINENCGNPNGENNLFTRPPVCIHAWGSLIQYAKNLGIPISDIRVHQGATPQTAALEHTVTKPPIVIATVTSGTLTPRKNTSNAMLH